MECKMLRWLLTPVQLLQVEYTILISLHYSHSIQYILLIEIFRMERTKNIEITDNFNLNQKFSFIDIIGQGCFGKIFRVYSKRRNQYSALKIQEKRNFEGCFLEKQAQKLQKLQGIPGVPKIFSFGSYDQGYYLEMELLQTDLSNSKSFTLPEITHLTIEMLTILYHIHSKNIIHQDIKPQNMMKSKDNIYYLIDYGLSKVQSRKNYMRRLNTFVGTPRYASINAHQMREQSKKDDLESLFYNIAFLYYRKLPWSKLNVTKNNKLQKIRLMKHCTKGTLFQQMGETFSKAFQYIDGLQAGQMPNYRLLIGYFKRHKSLLEKPKVSNELIRQNIKKNSLNYSNFLQVPQNPYKSKSKVCRQNECGQISSNSSISACSDVVLSQLLNNQQFFESLGQENVDIDQNIEPVVPKIKHITCSFFQKNPFTLNA